MQALDIAQSWTDQGIGVLPIGYRDKRPDFSALKRRGYVADDGRTSWDNLKTELPSTNDLRAWFAGERRNLGIITGWRNLVVIDFDTFGAYQLWRQWLASKATEVNTYEVVSGRGVHVYVFTDEPVEAYKVADIDIKAAGGYVLAPPSVHPSGRRYVGKKSAIMHVEQLSDIFPIEKPAQLCEATQAPKVYCDPLEAACLAREEQPIGGGAIALIKSSLTWFDVLGKALFEARHGATMIRCPLHNDHSPSMVLYPDLRFHCFGCGAHGDILDLVAAMEHITLRQAIAELLVKIG